MCTAHRKAIGGQYPPYQVHLPPGLYSAHSVIPTETQPSGGIWLETQTSFVSEPDFSTALRFARNDSTDGIGSTTGAEISS